MPTNPLRLAALGLALIASPMMAQRSTAGVDFNRDIRPILSENCFHCHGADADQRKAKLRLDTAEGVVAGKVIAPGNPDESELIKRILTNDPDDQMPPVDSNRHLSAEQKKLLSQWVSEGARYETHWAFTIPSRPLVPAVKQKKWARNEMDHFVLARLEAEKLRPTPEAPMPKLLRRVSLDLAGLPPAPEQIKNWMAKSDPFNAALDELLASPRFGERMASDWMDVARYADTHGFNNDSARSMWRWRDWVIEAFNRNLPYDQFIIEQLAGDLLPNPTVDQLIATGFNRNHVINSEGGIIDEEYRVEYVGDRVRTTSMAWLGLTMECARCHDHKFDPISQKDYFRIFAFFNNVTEHGEAGRIANAAPFIVAPTASQQKEMDQHRIAMEGAFAKMNRLIGQQDWSNISFDALNAQTDVLPIIPETNRIVELDSFSNGETTISNRAGGKPFQIQGRVSSTPGPMGRPALLFDGNCHFRTEALPKGDKKWALSFWVRRDEAAEGVIFSTMNYQIPVSSQQHGQGVEVRFAQDGALEVRAARRWPAYSANILTHEKVSVGEWHHVLVGCDGSEKAKGIRVFINGDECFRTVLQDDFATSGITGDAQIAASSEEGGAKFQGAISDFYLWAKAENLNEMVEVVRNQFQEFARINLKEKIGSPSDDNESAISSSGKRAFLSSTNAEFKKLHNKWRHARETLLQLEREAPTTMVMKEAPVSRPTHILFRGQYDQPRERVEPGVPDFLPSLMPEPPRTRLEFAQWIAHPDHPLTARVVVNRFWQNLFGTGIVKTSEDFGFQAEYPSHPELLDWLAIDFVENGWNVKRLLRQLVTSATYRQDSRSTPELSERDSENRLLARGPRLRLTAEMLRDQALAVSGLLEETVGGPPVYPYQPAHFYKGIVVAAAYPGTTYEEGTGADLYRRSLYTFWKRTVPHPTLATFDAPDREVCVARRIKTNTPLQALALMNDVIQLEASRKLAERMLLEGGKTDSERIRFAFALATARAPGLSEQKMLRTFLNARLAFYQNDSQAAEQLLSLGASKRNEKLDAAKLAAYANVASLILNLDETVTRN